MVNLVRGRRSFYCTLGKEASIVMFSGNGDHFYMVVSVHEAEDAKIVFELDNKKKVFVCWRCIEWVIVFWGEDKNITAWDTKSGQVAYTIEGAHPARVKGVVVLSKNDDTSSEDDPYTVASASSDGVIRVWDVCMPTKDKPNPLAEVNTKSRLTCLAGSSVKSLGRPRIGEASSGENQEPLVDES